MQDRTIWMNNDLMIILTTPGWIRKKNALHCYEKWQEGSTGRYRDAKDLGHTWKMRAWKRLHQNIDPGDPTSSIRNLKKSFWKGDQKWAEEQWSTTCSVKWIWKHANLLKNTNHGSLMKSNMNWNSHKGSTQGEGQWSGKHCSFFDTSPQFCSSASEIHSIIVWKVKKFEWIWLVVWDILISALVKQRLELTELTQKICDLEEN